MSLPTASLAPAPRFNGDVLANAAPKYVPQRGSLSLTKRVDQLNKWREQYNPLRGLTIAKAVQWLEQFERGEMADLQWAYYFIENRDADLMALVERRTSAIGELDWNIKTIAEDHPRWDGKLAEDQSAALREAYEQLDNLQEAFEHLAMASFRGYAHLEKHYAEDGRVIHLEVCDQWNVVRQGFRGPWKYNPEGLSTNFERLGEDRLIDPAHWIIRESRRHINRVGLVKFVRQNLSQKDWDAFVEIYGVPGVVIFAPPGLTDANDIAKFETAAGSVAEGGSGTLPNGSVVTPIDGPRGVNPFRDHLRHLQEQLVLAGTGGLLTMLAQSGSGTLAGNAHQDTFEKIARAEARKISEVLQKAIDAPLLESSFAGQPRLAYFELAANEEQDTGQIVEHAQKLSLAGYVMDSAELSEKTGYTLAPKTEVVTDPFDLDDEEEDEDEEDQDALRNRAGDTRRDLTALEKNALAQLGQALSNDLQPLRRRLENILQIPDAEILRTRLQAFKSELPELLLDLNTDPATAQVIEQTISAALWNGVDEAARDRKEATP